jgi:predicted aldo/keto reductase-like oxidoreductase
MDRWYEKVKIIAEMIINRALNLGVNYIETVSAYG